MSALTWLDIGQLTDRQRHELAATIERGTG